MEPRSARADFPLVLMLTLTTRGRHSATCWVLEGVADHWHSGTPARIGEHDRDSLCKDLQVQQKGPLANVRNVELTHPLVIEQVPTRHLPQTGNPRFDVQPLILTLIVQLEFVRQLWPRTDQAHVTT